MSCFTIATMNGDTLASGDYAFAYMATNALPPVVGMLFMICGLSATSPPVTPQSYPPALPSC